MQALDGMAAVDACHHPPVPTDPSRPWVPVWPASQSSLLVLFLTVQLCGVQWRKLGGAYPALGLEPRGPYTGTCSRIMRMRCGRSSEAKVWVLRVVAEGAEKGE